MDILFVDAFQQSSIINFPIGINLLSTIINRNSNYISEVISFPNLLAEEKVPENILIEKNYEVIVKYILNKKPKIVSFYTIGGSFFISLIVAKNIKKADENIKIIFAGPHVSLCSQETLKAFDFIDMVAVGEGEQNIISIIDYFNNKEKIENIKGICYKESNQIVCKEPSPLIKNLDELPMLELNKDTLPSKIFIETGRGCPYNCTFCSTKTFWRRKVRLKSIDRLINEIKYYINKYDVRKFSFVHDLFTASKENVFEFCSKIEELETDIEWSCSARTDTLDEEIISLMAKAGCKKINLGIETGSERMQNVINKHLNISEIKEIIKLIDRYGIDMQASFIYGLPTETEEDLMKTLSLIRFCIEEVSIQESIIHKCACYPSTQVYLTEKNNLIYNEDNFYLFRYPGKNHGDLIKKYPDLFSNLFIPDSMLLKKYFYLDMFINYVYKYFAFRTPKTIKEILRFYDNSLLSFYLEYEGEMKRITDSLTRTIYYGDKLSDVREEMSKSLELFIKNNINDDFLEQLYRFEVATMKTLLGESDKGHSTYDFDYDMLLYYQETKKQKEKCKLVFMRTENNEVKIYKENK